MTSVAIEHSSLLRAKNDYLNYIDSLMILTYIIIIYGYCD